MPPTDKFFLIIGGANSESTTSRITAEGLHYRRKLLHSKPKNWQAIIDILGESRLRAVIVVLTGNDYNRLLDDEYALVADKMLDALAKVPHTIFIHEQVFLQKEQRGTGPTRPEYEPPVNANAGFNWYDDMTPDQFFGEVPDELRDNVNEMLATHQLNVLPYRTNAERSVMAGRFLEDLDRNLFFRIYIPAGRLYAEEASTLLGLFRDWLNQTGRDSIRQDGYSTPSGQVYEFFGEQTQPQGELGRHFQDFSDFLDSCQSAPEEALDGLIAAGVESRAADMMVTRYAKAGRRLHLDLRQTREQRILSLRHQMEEELLTDNSTATAQSIEWLNQVVPDASPAFSALRDLTRLTRQPDSSVQITVNQQFIGTVSGNVLQNLQGTANLGMDAQELLALIRDHGAAQTASLESSLHELEDEQARNSDRVVARQKLRGFLSSIGRSVSAASIATLQKYLENRLGL
ncbi:hypothetical protein D8W71_22185 [Rhodococcus sp. P1Y]|nr:hypothetical protein D8W71_22185 [Rhodococcus sp. P1Y]